MSLFPLPPELNSLHDDVIQYASDLQALFDEKNPMSSYALANIHYTAILCHRGVRMLCEQGWTPLSSILIRTMLDHCASCIAVAWVPEQANYMGFKYFARLFIKLSTDPVMTEEEHKEPRGELEKLVNRLPPEDQSKARDLIKENKSRTYWYSPEYQGPGDLLKRTSAPIQELYRLFSGPAHGGFSLQVFFSDDSTVQDINPRAHPRWTLRAIEASSRLLLEISHTRDVWDKLGHLSDYEKLLQRVIALR